MFLGLGRALGFLGQTLFLGLGRALGFLGQALLLGLGRALGLLGQALLLGLGSETSLLSEASLFFRLQPRLLQTLLFLFRLTACSLLCQLTLFGFAHVTGDLFRACVAVTLLFPREESRSLR